MNFTNRDGSSNGRQQTTAPVHSSGTNVQVATTPNTTLKHPSTRRGHDWVQISWRVMFGCMIIVVGALVWLFCITKPYGGDFVDSKRLQAVFLTNGQVYFGHIRSITSKYIDLSGIFYLNNSNSTAQTASNAADMSLIKLGCELHGPTDMMVINQTQVTFWENLRDDGQVAKAIAAYVQKNPNGLSCTQTSSTTGNTSSTPASSSTSADTTKKQ